jgi:hypothetical protein
MSQSLLEHGRVARFAFPPPIGALLDVDLEDGARLRIHLNEAVPPDWADGRTVVLGPGVLPDPGVLSRCPYVYRVRCDPDGASRQVWIGTQSLAHPTEWEPISDCAWTDEGLITTAATRILSDRSPTTDPATTEPQRHLGPLPESVTRLIRGLEAAQRTGTVEHVRRLCAGSGPFLDSLSGTARGEAEQALREAQEWLTSHEDYQQQLFAELDKAVTEKRSWDVRFQLQQAAAQTRHGASASEQRVLMAARAFLREQNHLPGTDTGRIARPVWLQPPPARPRRPTSPQPPTTRRTPKKSPTPNAARTERKTRRAAVANVRSILQRLNHRSGVNAAEQRKLIAELSKALEAAGDWLSARERNQAANWINNKAGTSKPEGSSRSAARTAAGRPPQERRPLAPDVLASASAAVRGALKKAARGQTITTWARLEQQLGSALPPMTPADRIQVLILVDQATPADQAPLSALVAAGDPELTTAYRTIGNALGMNIPADEDDLRDVLDADVQQVHHHWRHH